jgi:hypothetical protein
MSRDSPPRDVAKPARRQEVVREIREELERIRKAEAKVAESLGGMRASRTRIEELARLLTADERRIRELVREELESQPLPGAPALAGERIGGVSSLFQERVPGDEDEDDATDEVQTPAERVGRHALWLVGVAAACVLAVGGVGWLALQTFQGDREADTLTLAGSDPVEEEQMPGIPPAEPLDEVDAGEAEQEETERFFVTLPADARLRAAVYDSLFSARSPLFDPLLESVAEATEEGAVEESLGAWQAEGPLGPLEEDLLRAAIVQYVLREEVGGELAVDGQLLRNPCRGSSCSALLNLWESRGGDYGLPPVPEDAPRNPDALRVAENVVVLAWLQETHGVRAP